MVRRQDEDLESQVARMARELEAQRAELDALGEALSQARRQADDLAAELERRLSELARARERAARFNRDVRERAARLRELRQKLKALRQRTERLEQLRREVAPLRTLRLTRSPLRMLRALRHFRRRAREIEGELAALRHEQRQRGESLSNPQSPSRAADQPTLTCYVFYHDAAKLARVTEGLDDERFQFVDLNALPLPDYLQVDGMDGRLNRALFSEYLGLLSVKPATELVGFFTYSIPIKFSYEWAHFTKGYETFLPEIKFADLKAARFDAGKLYAVELNNPLRKFPTEVRGIHERFRVGGKRVSPLAPFKGSMILETKVFYGFQRWFGEVCAHLMRTFPWRDHGGENSPFSASPVAAKNESEKATDRLRHGIGDLMERAAAYYFGQVYPENAKVRLGEHIRHHQIDPALREVVESCQRNKLVIVTLANAGYANVLDNWLRAMQRLGIGNILVVALDQELYDALAGRTLEASGTRRYLLPCGRNLGDLWVKRLQLFRDLNDLGVDFIHSDTDAVWLKNPLLEFFRDPGPDIVASPGTVWPHDVHSEWGFVLCCGLFFVRASKKMSYFLHEMLEDVARTKDDQVSLNRLLQRDRIRWTIRAPYPLPFRGKTVTCSRQSIEGRGENLQVSVLPHHLFQRLPMPDEVAYVKHILSPKTSADKIEILKEHGCYVDRDEDENLGADERAIG
ncbi:MAG: putative nucleotide-diphospho-sugar transferase [Planctomycetota bacterium]